VANISQPESALSQLTCLPHLTHFSLDLHLDETCHEFIERSDHLIEDAAQQRAIGLYRQLHVESLALTFRITYPARSWMFRVSRGRGGDVVVARECEGVEARGIGVDTPAGGAFDPFG
jgi:hypothetical protein